MAAIKPRKLKWDEIREQAEDFRQKFVHPADLVPVPIEEIIEFDLQLNIWPIENLLQTIDIDGFLSQDLQTIFVDKTIYMDSRYNRRLRFTYAHEIGHLVFCTEKKFNAVYFGLKPTGSDSERICPRMTCSGSSNRLMNLRDVY